MPNLRIGGKVWNSALWLCCACFMSFLKPLGLDEGKTSNYAISLTPDSPHVSNRRSACSNHLRQTIASRFHDQGGSYRFRHESSSFSVRSATRVEHHVSLTNKSRSATVVIFQVTTRAQRGPLVAPPARSNLKHSSLTWAFFHSKSEKNSSVAGYTYTPNKALSEATSARKLQPTSLTWGFT